MPYVHSVTCSQCERLTEVCTPDEDGYVWDTEFQYRCPKCETVRNFFTRMVQYIEGTRCPKNTVPGELVKHRQINP